MIYSSLVKRFLAHLIDTAIIGFLSMLFIWGGYVGVLISAAVAFLLYNAIMTGSPLHATLGQVLFGISIVDEDGYGIGYLKATLRTLCFLLSSLLLCVGHIVVFLSDEKQALHDRLAGTFVVDGVDDGMDAVSSKRKTAYVGRLIGIAGEKKGESYVVQKGGLLIGFDPTVCNIVMENAKGVSKIHCHVSYNSSNGTYVISDRNSTYGTFTQSGKRIHPLGSTAIKCGERFYLGSPQNMFEVV